MKDPISVLKEKGGSSISPLRWEGRVLRLIDQRLVPYEIKWLDLKSWEEVRDAIRDMVVRGAPAIGITAAFGMAICANGFEGDGGDELLEVLEEAGIGLNDARPTAVNLSWAVKRMLNAAQSAKDAGHSVMEIKGLLEKEAINIWMEDVISNLEMGKFGAQLIKDGSTILTHCNAGALATGGYGTALGVVRYAHFSGKRIKVLADETRPWLQGIRLTAWELMEDGIEVEVICDNAAGFFMKRGEVDCVVVGADRIALNGDVANKIGTYSVAELAKANSIPFYVAAPFSTIDVSTRSGEAIPIEERSSIEVTTIKDITLGPENVIARNPVFDVTPNELITAIITDRGIISPPYEDAIARCLRKSS